MTPAGIEPATFRFVAQHLNHCVTAVPLRNTTIFYYFSGFKPIPFACYLSIVHDKNVPSAALDHYTQSSNPMVSTSLTKIMNPLQCDSQSLKPAVALTSDEPFTSDMLNLIQCIHQYNISTKTGTATKIWRIILCGTQTYQIPRCMSRSTALPSLRTW